MPVPEKDPIVSKSYAAHYVIAMVILMGVPATGKTIRVGYVDFWRLEQGKAVENWVQMDLLGLT